MTDEEILRKKIRLHKYHVVADIILIAVILLISCYVYSNIESFKLLNQDVCAYCMEKTGAKCYYGNFYASSEEGINLTEEMEEFQNAKG